MLLTLLSHMQMLAEKLISDWTHSTALTSDDTKVIAFILMPVGVRNTIQEDSTIMKMFVRNIFCVCLMAIGLEAEKIK